MKKYNLKLTVNILTYKTNKKILRDCINSIDKNIQINIIENSKNFQDKKYFLKMKRNINFFCTGKNFGYGKGHNFGFSKVKNRYVLICNPDVVFKKNYFKIVNRYLKNNIEFHIIGSQYSKNKMDRPAYGLFNNKTINPKIREDVNKLQKVDWVVGCTMLFDLSKFPSKKIFDENFFLFYEETDLCQRILARHAIIYSASELIINHQGEKSSFAIDPKLKLDYIKLRNWHLLWSSFYYEKKHYGYINSLLNHFIYLFKDLIKIFFFGLMLNKEKFIKHLYRFLGLTSSIIGKKSSFRTQ